MRWQHHHSIQKSPILDMEVVCLLLIGNWHMRMMPQRGYIKGSRKPCAPPDLVDWLRAYMFIWGNTERDTVACMVVHGECE